MWKRNVLRPYSVLAVLLCGLIGANAFAVGEAAQTFTLDGQLLQAGSDDPLLDTNAKIVFQVLDPSKTCLLYEERQFVNTSSSNGYYNIQIGSNTSAEKRTANDPGRTMVQIFQNRAAITANSAPGETCAGGAYTPSPMDVRYFRLIVTPSATNIADTLSPDTVMDSVANSLVAQTIQGITPEQILQVGSSDLTQANLQTVFAAGNTAKLMSLLSVNPSNFVTKDSTNGTILIPPASTPGSPQAGQIWYDSGALKFWNGSAEQTLGISGSGVASVVAGTGLNVGAGPGGTISSSGTLNVDVGVADGQIVQVQTGGKLPALNGSDLTSLNGSAVQSGTIGGTAALSTSGNIQTTNDVTAERLFVYDNSGVGPGFVGLKTVADIAGGGGASYTLTLPNTAGGSGQVLRTDGTGILSWITPNVGTVTNVATGTGLSGGPISGSGTISLADTLVTPGNYGSATQVATFTVDQQGRLTAAGNTTISGVAPGGAASGDLSGSFPGPTVAKIQNINVSNSAPTAAGHVLRYNGTTQYIPGFLGIGDIRSTVGPGYAQFFPLSCTVGQTLTWNVVTDQMDCTNIGISDSQVTYASKTQNTFLAAPNGSNGAPTFRTIAAADLPSISSGISGTLPIANGGTGVTSLPGTFVLNGGQAGAVTLGPSDANSLTLNTNGTGKMTILSNGNVGIGTTTPTARLEVQDTLLNIPTLRVGTTADEETAENSVLGQIAFSADDDSVSITRADTGYIKSISEGCGSGAPCRWDGNPANAKAGLGFFTMASLGTTAEALRITNTGNVGIGTASPTALLDLQGGHLNIGGTFANPGGWNRTVRVEGTLHSAIRLVGGSAGGMVRVDSTVSPQVAFGSETNHDFAIFTNGHTNTRLAITSSGNVGIGTTSPTQKLDVNGAINSNGIFYGTGGNFTFRNAGGSWLPLNSAGLNIGDWDSAPGYGDLMVGTYDFNLKKDDTESLLIVKNTGNVGIGTTTPQSTLQVNGYVQLALTLGAPPAADCDAAAERGRMKVDSAAGLLYICMDSGWVSK